MYNREQVYEATLKYFNGDELASNVWIDKYCLKHNGFFYELTPDDMHRRLAKEFARIEKKYPNPMSEEEIYQLFKDFSWIVPQGSPMAGIGNPYVNTSISNCFVIGGKKDSYGGIFKADEEQGQLMKRRGGVGGDLSFLRPSGAWANGSILGPNAGSTLYMDRYSNTTREVQQDGRRGALMLSIDIKHPDAEKFIDKKMTPGKVTGANVSVRISSEFMQAVKKQEDFFQVWPIEHDITHIKGSTNLDEVPYNELMTGKIINGKKTYFKKIDPNYIWNKIVHNAWKSAEPGILFWDTILDESPAKGYGEKWREVSTNPCGEIPLPSNDSCRLLVLNLYNFAHKGFTENALLEDTLLWDLTKKAQRLMDDIVDLEIEKIDKILEDIKKAEDEEEFYSVEVELWTKIREMAVQGRRTGLGVTGEGDLIAALGYTYGTPIATEFSDKLHQFISTAAYQCSIELAEERGHFPTFDYLKDDESDFIKRMFSSDNALMEDEWFKRYMKAGRRNIGVLTIAPTGSVSLLTQTTSGIEPLFAAWYFRKKKVTTETKWDYVDEVGDKWVEFPVFHKPFIDWYAAVSKVDSNVAKFNLSKMNKEQLEKLLKVSPYHKATAQDVDYVEKVKMQGAVQKWIDHSISVTVNMPESVTEQMVADVYKMAFESGCKGVTVYRDNSRGNVLSTTSVKEVKATIEDSFEYIAAHKRPKFLDCDIFFKSAQKEPWIILVGKVGNKPYEVFAVPYNEKTKISKTHTSGQIFKSAKGKYDLIGDNGMPLINNITSHMIETEQNETRSISALLRHRVDPQWIVNSIIEKYATINSFHKVIGRVLMSYLDKNDGVPCPSCDNGIMIMSEGCMKCKDCGYAHCG